MEHFYRAQQNLSSLHKIGWRPAEKNLPIFFNMRVFRSRFVWWKQPQLLWFLAKNSIPKSIFRQKIDFFRPHFLQLVKKTLQSVGANWFLGALDVTGDYNPCFIWPDWKNPLLTTYVVKNWNLTIHPCNKFWHQQSTFEHFDRCQLNAD
jgi:hypothetical protein